MATRGPDCTERQVSNVGDVFKLAAVLTVVALCSGLAVSFTNSQTREEIALREQEKQTTALEQVFPEGVEIDVKSGEKPLPATYWMARKNANTVGYAFESSAKGYAAPINLMVAVDPQGEILGLAIIDQKETPGLGTRVEETISDKYVWAPWKESTADPTPWFTRQFKGIDVNESIDIEKSAEYHTLSSDRKKQLREKNAITAITGATISTRAVINGVGQSVPAYLRELTSGRE
ncbi:MAG: RnfABCDGE type electron transport complex subunit G [Chitinivibrionales bacterium]|nr:RnfABCDGE type electron transport complex subunit G [Chitinivibrionales bacterium]